MTFLLIAVAVLLSLVFGLVAVATSPTERDKTLRRRLAEIPSSAARSSSTQAMPDLLKSVTLTAGRLNGVFERFSHTQKLRKYVAQSASAQTLTSLFSISFALGIAGFVLAIFFAPALPLELLAACALASLPMLRVAWRRSSRLAAFSAALPDAVDTMARALRAGHSMAAAIEIVSVNCVGLVAFEFGEVFRQQNFGLPLREALLQMLDRVPSQDLRILVTAILVQRESGGNLIELLDRTAAILRHRIRIRGEIRVHTAQGRMTGWVLSLLPVVMLLMINLVNPGYSRILFTDPVGRKLIYLGVGLIVAGAAVINRMVNGIEV